MKSPVCFGVNADPDILGRRGSQNRGNNRYSSAQFAEEVKNQKNDNVYNAILKCEDELKNKAADIPGSDLHFA
jgi:hypothetical protein